MEITYPFINEEHLYSKYYKDFLDIEQDIPDFEYVLKRVRFENDLMRDISMMCFKKLREKILEVAATSQNPTLNFSEFIKLDIVRYHLFENSFINLFAILEDYLSKVCIYIETKKGEISNTLKKELLHNSFTTNINYLDEKYSLGLKESIDKRKDFALLKARRHCLTHELGIINLSNYNRLGYEKDKIGGKIIIDDVTYGQSSSLIILIAKFIDLTLKKHFPDCFKENTFV